MRLPPEQFAQLLIFALPPSVLAEASASYLEATEETAGVVILSKSGAHVELFENLSVLLPDCKFTVILILPTVVQLLVDGKLTVLEVPPFMLNEAMRCVLSPLI